MSDFRALDFRVPDFRELVKSKVDCEHIATLILRPYILPDRSRSTTRGVWQRRIHRGAGSAVADRIARSDRCRAH